MTGSGKSALINSIFRFLDVQEVAVIETAGKEGTRFLLSQAITRVASYDTSTVTFRLNLIHCYYLTAYSPIGTSAVFSELGKIEEGIVLSVFLKNFFMSLKSRKCFIK